MPRVTCPFFTRPERLRCGTSVRWNSSCFGGFQSQRGTPSSHPFRTMGCSIIKHPAIRVAPFTETPFSMHRNIRGEHHQSSESCIFLAHISPRNITHVSWRFWWFLMSSAFHPEWKPLWFSWIWRFPKMGVPPNHPFKWDFPLQTIHFGVPPCVETNCCTTYYVLAEKVDFAPQKPVQDMFDFTSQPLVHL